MSLTSAAVRDYDAIARAVSPAGDRNERMRRALDVAWEHLKGTGVSWLGYYVKTAGRNEMLLAMGRDTPACSPIGLHGACGQVWKSRRSLVVTDVANLGEGYVACDPRDRSELVIPLMNALGECWGVLDADSHQAGSFSEADAAGMLRVMQAAGLSEHAPVGVEKV